MTKKRTGRVDRIITMITAMPAGVTLSEIHTAEPSATRQQVSSTLAQLTAAGKIRRSGARRKYLYFATADVLVDKRRKAAAPTTPKPPAQSKAGKPKAASQIQIPPSTGLRATKPHVQLPFRGVVLREGLTSEGLAADVDAFLRKGGRIEKLAPGAVSQPLQCMANDDLRDFGDSFAAA